jgi:hypothetical protein
MIDMTKSLLREGVGMGGAALIAYGAWLAYAPAGYLTAGLFLMAGAVLSAMNAKRS